MGICRYCGQSAKLIKAHIIPESFFTRLNQGDQAALFVRQGVHVKRARIGIYDTDLLCSICEVRFGPYDDYAQQVLTDSLPLASAIRYENATVGWEISAYSYPLLKLYFISLLWRASASRHPFYARIDLGPLEKRAKTMLETQSPGSPDEFSVVVARFEHPFGAFIMDPHMTRFDGARWAVFYLGRYVAYVKAATRKTIGTLQALCLRPGAPLMLAARNLDKSKELPTMQRVVQHIKPFGRR